MEPKEVISMSASLFDDGGESYWAHRIGCCCFLFVVFFIGRCVDRIRVGGHLCPSVDAPAAASAARFGCVGAVESFIFLTNICHPSSVGFLAPPAATTSALSVSTIYGLRCGHLDGEQEMTILCAQWDNGKRLSESLQINIGITANGKRLSESRQT